MACMRFSLPLASTATGTAAKTLIQLVAPSSQMVAVLGWTLNFDGTSSTATPIRFRLIRQTTAGTMSALTPVKLNDSIGDSIRSTAQQNATAEPTASDILDIGTIHPQQSKVIWYPPNHIVCGAGDRIGLEVLAGTGVNAFGVMWCEE
jgi:hypothetical protein